MVKLVNFAELVWRVSSANNVSQGRKINEGVNVDSEAVDVLSDAVKNL